MNVILIPFFLAANVVVKDTSEWTYGPEYLYNMNFTVVIKSDNLNPAEPIGNMELISTCRPMVAENSLLCIVQNYKINVDLKTVEEENTTHEMKTEKMIKIKFNERGVESLIVPPSLIRNVAFNLMRVFASQLSVGVDMRKIGMSHFTSDESISMVNCATMYRITREELPETLETHTTDNADFQLVVLPMADARPGTTLTIEKSRMGCNFTPRYHKELGTLKVSFFSKVYVDGASGFETYTEMDMEMPKEFLNLNISTTFAFNIRLSLDSIVPAQDPLPSISKGDLFDVNLYDILKNMY